MKIFDYEEVVMNWDSFTYPIAVGTPVSVDGVLADNSSAHGLIARTVFAKPDGGDTLKIMTGGFIDMEEIVAGYGQELSSAAVNALCGISFYKDGVCIPSGGSGGGGVTPEIMAQIENAQWKSESSGQLFSETVTTVAEGTSSNALLSYAEPIAADTLKVTFDGTEYTCPKIEIGPGVYGYGGASPTGSDFTEFPFSIISLNGSNRIFTETAGTYSVSASEKQTTYTKDFTDAVESIGWAYRAVSGETTMTDIYYAVNNQKLVYFYPKNNESGELLPYCFLITGYDANGIKYMPDGVPTEIGTLEVTSSSGKFVAEVTPK